MDADWPDCPSIHLPEPFPVQALSAPSLRFLAIRQGILLLPHLFIVNSVVAPVPLLCPADIFRVLRLVTWDVAQPRAIPSLGEGSGAAHMTEKRLGRRVIADVDLAMGRAFFSGRNNAGAELSLALIVVKCLAAKGWRRRSSPIAPHASACWSGNGPAMACARTEIFLSVGFPSSLGRGQERGEAYVADFSIIPADEPERLAAVRRYDVLDTPPDGAFDRITAIAARRFGVPIGIISVVDQDRIWFKSHHGLDVKQIGRDPGLCASAILSDIPHILPDATKDSVRSPIH